MNTGAVNVVTNGQAVQVIIGLNVPQLREECEKIVSVHRGEKQAKREEGAEITPNPAI